MSMRRIKLWISVVLGLCVLIGGWIVFQPRQQHVWMLTLSNSTEERLALKPNSEVVIEFNKPVSIETYTALWHCVGQIGTVLDVDATTNKVVFKVDDAPDSARLLLRDKSGESSELWIHVVDVAHVVPLRDYIEGETGKHMITRCRPLPRDSIIPIRQDNLGLRVRSVTPADKLMVAVRNILYGAPPQPPAAGLPPLPRSGPLIQLVTKDGVRVEVRQIWSEQGSVVRLHLKLRNQGQKPAKGISITSLKLGKQLPEGIQFPFRLPVIEPEKEQVLTFDFPNGDLAESLAIGWDFP